MTDLHIESVATDTPAGWLRTSPEYFHKRLLASGFGDLYELGPVFRRGESGRNHQPEFTLLEWYRVGWGWRRLAEEVVALIDHALPTTQGTRPVRWLGWNDCFLASLGIDALAAGTGELQSLADDAPKGLDRDALLDWLFATRIQPGFDEGTLTVVHDYPASQAALARLHPEDARVAERFEVFAGPMELANGYRELTDAREQRQRFERDNRSRRDNGQAPMPIDNALLEAMDRRTAGMRRSGPGLRPPAHGGQRRGNYRAGGVICASAVVVNGHFQRSPRRSAQSFPRWETDIALGRSIRRSPAVSISTFS